MKLLMGLAFYLFWIALAWLCILVFISLKRLIEIGAQDPEYWPLIVKVVATGSGLVLFALAMAYLMRNGIPFLRGTRREGKWNSFHPK